MQDCCRSFKVVIASFKTEALKEMTAFLQVDFTVFHFIRKHPSLWLVIMTTNVFACSKGVPTTTKTLIEQNSNNDNNGNFNRTCWR
jgi:hypothetical protein